MLLRFVGAAVAVLLTARGVSMPPVNANKYYLATQAVAFGAASVGATGGVARVAENPGGYTGLTGMAWNEDLKALCLQAVPRATYEADCSTEKVTVNAGAWRNVRPTGEDRCYLQNADCTPDQGAVQVRETSGTLTANPCVSARFYRAARPAGSTQRGAIRVSVLDTAGALLDVDVSDDQVNVLFDDGVGGSGGRYWLLSGDESAQVFGPGLVEIDAWMIAGRAVCYVAPLGRLFVLGPDDCGGTTVALATGKWITYADDAGSFAVNVSQVQFATTGTFTTPPIEHLRAIGVGEAAPTLTVYPPLPAGCSAVITSKAAVGTAYTYTITVTGDGYSPCPIQAVSVEYPATWGAAPRGAGWLAASATQLSGVTAAHETYPEDSLQRAGTVTQELADATKYAAFRAECAAHLSGASGFRDMNALVYEVGPAGSTVERWVGVVRQVEEASPLAPNHTLTYTVGGRGTAWADLSAVTVPALWGETLADAVSKILQRAGVHTADLDVSAAPAVNVVDPGWGYEADPTGAINGMSIQQALQTILADAGAVLRDKASGLFYLEPTFTPPGDWSTAPLISSASTTEAEKAAEVKRTKPYYQAWNAVLVLGRTPEGAVVRSYAVVTGAVGLPYKAVKVEDVGERAPTQAAADAIAAEVVASLHAGKGDIYATNRGGGWCDWWAGDPARVTDADLDLAAQHARITNLEIDFEEGLKIMPVTATLREEA